MTQQAHKSPPALARWSPEVEALVRHLRDVDLQRSLTRNPERREVLRLRTGRLAAQIEALKAAIMAAEVVA
jgi:hypothetical protein